MQSKLPLLPSGPGGVRKSAFHGPWQNRIPRLSRSHVRPAMKLFMELFTVKIAISIPRPLRHEPDATKRNRLMKRQSFIVLVSLFIQQLPSSAASPVVISEFMANNSRTLADEDGDFPDCIEIHNVGAGPVDLEHWSLTDNANNLTKWSFPATNLNVGAFMVVFASGKDRHTPGAPLHTSFKLNADGGYVALVEPDGLTIARQFAYPPQVPNVSFGIGQVSSNLTLLSKGAAARVLVPTLANGGSTLGDGW